MTAPGGRSHPPPTLALAGGRPEVVLRQLELTVSRRLDGLLQGDYQGLLPGPGGEPGDGRVYRPGDDVRRIDWSLTARTTVPHVRETVSDRELETWALVDCSASLDFGTADCEKRDLAVAATAAVGFLTARVGNRLGAVVLTDGGARRIPARQGRDALLAVLHVLVTTPRSAGGAPTDLAAGIDELVRPPRRRGLSVVVSDFLSDTDWSRPLRALAGRHDVLAIEVVDPRELELPDVGYLTVVDPETGRRREVQTASAKLRRRYAEAATAQRAEIARSIRRAGAHHLVLRTDRDWLLDVVRFAATYRHRRAALTDIANAPAGGPHPGTSSAPS